MNDSVNMFSVTGMTCDGCAQTIKTKLELESEISKADISFSSTKLIIHSSKKYKSEELNKIIKSVPDNYVDMDKIKPVYEIIKGWEKNTQNCKKISELPINAKKYIKRIEKLIECPVSMISTSPEREDTILIQDPFK